MWLGNAVTSSTLLADPPSNETIDVFYIKNYSWWWTRTASETRRVVKIHQINRISWISLVYYKTSITKMHDTMNIKCCILLPSFGSVLNCYNWSLFLSNVNTQSVTNLTLSFRDPNLQFHFTVFPATIIINVKSHLLSSAPGTWPLPFDPVFTVSQLHFWVAHLSGLVY